MPIAFACPKCSKAYKVKDELAGKKAACTQCKHVMLVPKVSMPMATAEESLALESLATATLTADERAAAAASEAEKTAAAGGPIPFECPFCFEAVEFPIDKAGKQSPCPACRRIVKVPVPKNAKPKDWREVDARPSFARIDTAPAPEGAWGNTQGLGGIVSREALLDAAVIVDRKTLAAPKRGKLYITLAVLAVLAAAIGFMVRGRQVTDDRRMSLVADAVKATEPKAEPPLPKGWSAVIHCAAGQFQLREQKVDLDAAKRHFQTARAATRDLDPVDRAGLLIEIAIAQADLVGDDPTRHLSREDAQKELRQTLQSFKELPRESGWAVIEAVTRKLGSTGDKKPLMSILAPMALPNESDRAEALAIVALVLHETKDAKADDVTKEAKDARTDGPASPRLVALLLATNQLAEARKLLQESTSEPSLPSRLAYAEGLASIKAEQAIKVASASGAVEHQAAAYAMLADAPNSPHLEKAVAFVAENGAKFTLPSWAIERLARACRRANRADLAAQLAGPAKVQPVKGWVELQSILAAEPTAGPMNASDADRCGDKTVAQALALAVIARHNARIAKSDPRSAIAVWPSPAAQAAGFAGAALGIQDRK